MKARRCYRLAAVAWLISSVSAVAVEPPAPVLPDGIPAFPGTWGGRNSTFHHNLFANNTGRVPSIGMSIRIWKSI